MIRIAKYLVKAVLLVWLLQTISCNSKIYDLDYQHSGYVNLLQKSVGKNFSSMRNRAGFAPDKNLLSGTKLANGNVVYKYRDMRTCRYMLEVDPTTDIIVSADWEGEKGDCIHVP